MVDEHVGYIRVERKSSFTSTVHALVKGNLGSISTACGLSVPKGVKRVAGFPKGLGEVQNRRPTYGCVNCKRTKVIERAKL
jgi:hypothetical protein